MNLLEALRAIYVDDHPELNPDERLVVRTHVAVLMNLVEVWKGKS